MRQNIKAMRYQLSLFASIALLAFSCACQLKAQVNIGDEQAVRNVVSDFAAAWNRHDAKAMAALHTEDVNFVNIFGQWWKGRKEVEDNLARAHATAFAKSKMLTESDQVKFPAPNVAIIQGTMELLNAPPETLGRCHSIRVMIKENGRWLISNFQNTSIRSGDPAAAKQ